MVVQALCKMATVRRRLAPPRTRLKAAGLLKTKAASPAYNAPSGGTASQHFSPSTCSASPVVRMFLPPGLFIGALRERATEACRCPTAGSIPPTCALYLDFGRLRPLAEPSARRNRRSLQSRLLATRSRPLAQGLPVLRLRTPSASEARSTRLYRMRTAAGRAIIGIHIRLHLALIYPCELNRMTLELVDRTG